MDDVLHGYSVRYIYIYNKLFFSSMFMSIMICGNKRIKVKYKNTKQGFYQKIK
jgi:hypothetical protein